MSDREGSVPTPQAEGLMSPSPEPTLLEMVALAHAVDPALVMLEVVAHKPVQGEAMHKVIGFYAYNALQHVGWLGPYGIVPGGVDVDPTDGWQKVYVIREPAPTLPELPHRHIWEWQHVTGTYACAGCDETAAELVAAP